MAERDERRRAALRRKRRRQQQNRRIFVGALFCLLVLILIFAAVLIRRRQAGNSAAEPAAGTDASAAESGGEPAVNTEPAAGSEAGDGSSFSGEDEALTDETEPEVKEVPCLTFTEADTRTGDLILVNRKYAYDFEANAATLDLVNIREKQSFYYQVNRTDMCLAARILPKVDKMIAACDEAVGTQRTGIESAHRSLEYQQRVWNEMTELYGSSYAEAYVAAPGYSEHHTGLAADIGYFYPDGSEGSFSESDNAVWMNENSWKYGFVRRYASDKAEITGFSNEAWHFRYVGIPHAAFMKQNNLCMEEYISYLESKTGPGNPLTVEAEGSSYRIYATNQLTIEKPENPYEISGTNTGYLVVTETLPN